MENNKALTIRKWDNGIMISFPPLSSSQYVVDHFDAHEPAWMDSVS